jgi:hypothetical protein
MFKAIIDFLIGEEDVGKNRNKGKKRKQYQPHHIGSQASKGQQAEPKKKIYHRHANAEEVRAVADDIFGGKRYFCMDDILKETE